MALLCGVPSHCNPPGHSQNRPPNAPDSSVSSPVLLLFLFHPGRMYLDPCRLCCGEGNCNPLQYSCLANPMDGGAWWAAVRGVARSWTRLSDFTFTFHFHALEKEMATHSSVLAWRTPGTGEPDGLPSMGSYRVGHTEAT